VTSSLRKAFIAMGLCKAVQVMLDGPVMLVFTRQAMCRIELTGNGEVRFDHVEAGGRRTTFVETETWSTPVLGFLADFYKEQQQDMMRCLTAEQQQDAFRESVVQAS
jgi:hypothetical protein